MRIAFIVFEFVAFLYVLYIILSQIIIPLYKGTRMFPFLYSKTGDFVDVRTDIEKAQVLREYEELQRELKGMTPLKDEVTNEADDVA